MKRAVVLMLMAGCGGGGTSSPDAFSEVQKSLCDPTGPSGARVGIKADGGFIGGEDAMISDNGAYIFVDSQCHYWVSPTYYAQPTHTGTLTSEQAAQYGARLHVGAWDALSREWQGEQASDSGQIIFDDSVHQVVCSGVCNAEFAPELPQPILDMTDGLAIKDELWTAGVPAAGSLRALAYASGPVAGDQVEVAWPLARPISDFLRADDAHGTGRGEGVLVDDSADLAALRQLRAALPTYDPTIRVTSGGVSYHVYVRDSLPFEGANGLVPFSGALGQ
ncbi:MAG TPA: hypothetical protein VGM39_02355 [Kofleriaceae bacterium]|jgi:hypothetical protein